MILLWFLVILLALAWGLADIQLRQPIQRPPPPPIITPAPRPPVTPAEQAIPAEMPAATTSADNPPVEKQQ